MTVPSLLAGGDPLASIIETSRTERQLCSVLQHLLLVNPPRGRPANLERFLDLVNDVLVRVGKPPLIDLIGFDPDLVDPLFEPATLRDYWHAFGPDTRRGDDVLESNRRKLEYLDALIRRLPHASQIVPELPKDPLELNRLFGSAFGRVPRADVGQPGRWWHLADPDRRARRATPLPIVHSASCAFSSGPSRSSPISCSSFEPPAQPTQPLVIEAKLESGPSSYPTGAKLRAIYCRRCCDGEKRGVTHRVYDDARQVDVQAFLYQQVFRQPARLKVARLPRSSSLRCVPPCSPCNGRCRLGHLNRRALRELAGYARH